MLYSRIWYNQQSPAELSGLEKTQLNQLSFFLKPNPVLFFFEKIQPGVVLKKKKTQPGGFNWVLLGLSSASLLSAYSLH